MSTDSRPLENRRPQAEADSYSMVSRSSEMARVESGQTRSFDQRGDVVLVLEARHRIVRLLLEQGARDAAGFLRLEQRQPAAMDQIVDEGRDEHRLAGARQAGDAEPQRRRDKAGRALAQRVERDQRLVGESGERRQSVSLCDCRSRYRVLRGDPERIAGKRLRDRPA